MKYAMFTLAMLAGLMLAGSVRADHYHGRGGQCGPGYGGRSHSVYRSYSSGGYGNLGGYQVYRSFGAPPMVPPPGFGFGGPGYSRSGVGIYFRF